MTTEQLRSEIENANRQFCEAAVRRDFTAIGALYTEEASILPPEAPIITGRQSIQEFWRTAASSMGITGMRLNTMDVERYGDAACELGEAELTLDTGSARMKYLVLWLHGADGRWRLHRDIWNSLP